MIGECYGINVIKYNKILLNMYRGDFETARENYEYARRLYSKLRTSTANNESTV